MADAILLIILVIGGIYTGVFSPSEAAAVGAGAALVFALIRRPADWPMLRNAIREAAKMIGMIFLIVVGAALFNFFIETSSLTQTLVAWIAGRDFPPLAVLVLLLVFYLALGCVMDSLSMILLTAIPTAQVMTGLGYDPVWFAVGVVSLVEIGLITPPVGMNVFILRGLSPEMTMATLSRGIVPFLAADAVRIILIVALPRLVLWLPHILGLGCY